MNEILDQLRTTLSTAFSTTFSTYFKGKQVIPAQDDLPMLCVYPISMNQSHSGTVRDKVVYNIGIEIQVSIKKYLDMSSGQGTQLDTLDALIDLVEERETDGDAKATTVLGIINANLTIGNKVLYTDNVQIDYSEYMLKGEFPVAKANVTFEAYDRPNR